jgi:hypothetical protein
LKQDVVKRLSLVQDLLRDLKCKADRDAIRVLDEISEQLETVKADLTRERQQHEEKVEALLNTRKKK